MTRLVYALWALTHPVRAWGPRCGDLPPWRLRPTARPCISYRGHPGPFKDGPVLHGDGAGFVWDATSWAYRGPAIDLAGSPAPLDSDAVVLFTEYPTGDRYPEDLPGTPIDRRYEGPFL